MMSGATSGIGTAKNPLISVVIATLNRADFLVKCIDSVLTGAWRNYEILIIDQGRDDKSKNVVKERFGTDPRVRYIHSEVVGLSNARNVGYKEARGEIVAYIDDDAVAHPEWLAAYAEVFTSVVPTPGMAGGKISPIWEIECPEWYPEERKFLLGLYDVGDKVQEFPGSDFPPGANFAVLKKAMDEVGGFDRRLGFDEGRKNAMIAGEDTMMGKKMKDADYKIYYSPAARVNHYIAGYKLKKKYFLRRHYWEGVTIITIMDYEKPFDMKRLLGSIKWHLKAMVKTGGEIVVPREKTALSAAARRMLFFGKFCYSLGICVRLGAILIGRR